MTDKDGGYLEIITSKSGQEMMKDLKQQWEEEKKNGEMVEKAEKAVELVQDRFDILTRSLRDRFDIDDPEAYADKLSTSWVATIKHGAKTAIDPEFRAVFEDYLKESESVLNAQAAAEAAKSDQDFDPQQALAQQIADERAYLIKLEAARAARTVKR